MGFKGVDHIVIRVKDIDAGIATWRDKFGMELERTAESDALGIKQAFFQLDNGGFIEIVAPTSAESAVGRAIESRGEGMHTMALEVDDIDETVKHLEESGVQLIGVGGPQVFIHPKSANGILVQLSPKR
ncbi:MAG: VOC family protein [bacterium]|nr:methylmalonyl-CoA epimerase [Gammaproteobacteria bacterium]HIL98859.1 methylmalonyl-CoA epimerase [Pseudomonadales bacterium]